MLAVAALAGKCKHLLMPLQHDLPVSTFCRFNCSTISKFCTSTSPPATKSTQEEELDKLYKMLEIEVRGNDPAVLKSYEIFATMAARELGITVGEWTTSTQGVQLFGMQRRGKLLAAASGGKGSAAGSEGKEEDSTQKWAPRETDWAKVLMVLHTQFGAIFSLVSLVWTASFATWLWGVLLTWLGMLGLTAGAHRLWAHRSYEAAAPLRAFLAACHTASGQGSIYNWVLEHRVHHKYHGTDDDPFNYRRGFLFSHVTSRLLKPHPRFDEVAATVDMSDIEADAIVMFQHRYWLPLTLVLGVALPMWGPLVAWGDATLAATLVLLPLRLGILWHVAGLISSGEQIWSLSAKNKYSVDANLVFFLNRSHWPQYHYLLPWDYRTGEFGSYDDDCVTTAIRVWTALGWAWGLRTVGRDAVRRALAASDDVVGALEQEGRRVAKQSLFLQ